MLSKKIRTCALNFDGLVLFIKSSGKNTDRKTNIRTFLYSVNLVLFNHQTLYHCWLNVLSKKKIHSCALNIDWLVHIVKSSDESTNKRQSFVQFRTAFNKFCTTLNPPSLLTQLPLKKILARALNFDWLVHFLKSSDKSTNWKSKFRTVLYRV